MTCRRCGEDIGDGSDNCPVCGISQHTYITPRNYHAIRTARPKRRNKWISVVSFVVVIAAVAGMLYLSNREGEKKSFQTVLDAFEEQDETKLLLAVGHFKKNHPNSPLIPEAEKYYRVLVNGGIDPEDIAEEVVSSAPETEVEARERAMRELVEQLTPIAKSQIMSVSGVILEPPLFGDAYGMRVKWRNMSSRTITEVRFSFEALDADGNPLEATASGSSRITLVETKYGEPNAEGGIYESIWLKVWHSDEIDSVRLIQVKIAYSDGTATLLPEQICELIT